MWQYLFPLVIVLTIGYYICQLFIKAKIPEMNLEDLPAKLTQFQQDIGSGDKWTLQSVNQGVRVWTSSGSPGAFKCEVVVKASLEIVARVLEFPSLESEWNPLVKKIETIQQDKDKQHLTHVINVAHRRLPGIIGWLFLPRVYTIARIQDVGDIDDEMFVFFESTLWLLGGLKPKSPEIQGYVRQGGYKVKRIDRNSCHVTFSVEQTVGSRFFPFTLTEGLYSKNLAYSTALGFREFFEHQTVAELSTKIYEITKDMPTTKLATVKREKPSLASQGKKLVEELLKTLPEDSSWTFLSETNGIKIRTKKVEGSGMAGIYGVGIVKFPQRAIFDCVRNLKDKKKFDSMFASGHVVEVFTPNTSINYQAFEPVFPTQARDFVSLEYWTVLEDNLVVVVAKHATHPKVPEKSSHVRAEVTLAGFVIKPIANDFKNCEVQYYAHTDLKGSLPQAIVNMAIQKAPLIIDGIRKFLEKQNLSQYEGRERVLLEETGETATNDTSVNNSNNSTNSSPVKNPAPTVPKEFSQLIEMTYQDILSDLNNPNWTFAERKKDITISRKGNENSPIQSFKGEGVINRPLEEVRDYIFDTTTRQKYDNMCKKVEVVKTFGPDTKIVYTLHSTNQCILKTERDFLLLMHSRYDEKEQRHFIFAKSIDRDDIHPKLTDVTRAELLTSGWILTNNGKVTLVTYIVQVDLKGKIPVSVVNLVSVKQPLCIHYLRIAMDEDNGGGDPIRKGSSSSISSLN